MTYQFKSFHYIYAPQALVVVFTIVVQILAVYGSTDPEVTWSLVGNFYSWTVVALMSLWALASLWVPGKEFKGPETASGFTPTYRANGFQYFLISFFLYVTLLFFRPNTAIELTQNFPQILATCNALAFVFCLYLLNEGKANPDPEEKLEEYPFMYEFYRGMQVHPRIFGVDVKQLTNCRFGLMAWLLLILTFFVNGCLLHGFNLAFFVCVLLQTIYLAKFYWWETGYFNTLDITLDRAGWYICWGCITWVPAFYTFSSYFLATRPPLIGTNGAWIILFFGIISTTLNYVVDWEKEYFRKHNGRCRLWGRMATFVKATYKNKTGMKHTQLLTSGFWGVARHLNYLFEIMLAISWSLPSLGYGIWPFLYPMFLTVLLIHRIFRDEKKCEEKYGKAWKEYCEKVPYRIIPGVF